ncbi:MAG: hypothetical protein GX675_07670 [Erysipelotrichaceae bacterium]|nr:hypothetical protein [Erysipelotrichaceae bacterium]
MKELMDDTQLKNGWVRFQNTFEYAKDIEFKETVLSIEKALNEIFRVYVKKS